MKTHTYNGVVPAAEIRIVHSKRASDEETSDKCVVIGILFDLDSFVNKFLKQLGISDIARLKHHESRVVAGQVNLQVEFNQQLKGDFRHVFYFGVSA